jgi:hypothetical protein
MKVLLTLGDSWTQGAELGRDELPYGKLLRTQMKFDLFYNFGKAGASNEHMVQQLQSYFDQYHRPYHQITVIGFLTNPHRTAYWPHGADFNVNGHQRSHWDLEAKEVFMQTWLHFHQDEITVLRNSLAICALQTWCARYNISDYYFSGWNHYPTWLPCVNVDKIWAQGKETAADWFGATNYIDDYIKDAENNPYIRPNNCHPNQLGHQLIADRLQSWIENKQ